MLALIVTPAIAGPARGSATVSRAKVSAIATSFRPSWSQEFEGPSGTPPDAGWWSYETGGAGWGNNELETNTNLAANAALNGQGDLAVTARRQSYTGADGIARQYTSARLVTSEKFDALYGRVEARIQVPAGQGLLPQLWALGQNDSSVGWPQSGEIDLMEILGNDPYDVMGSIHGPQPGGAGPASSYGLTTAYSSRTPLSAGSHTYGMEWSPGEVRISVDRQVYASYTPLSLPLSAEWVFDHPFYLVLDLAVGGNWPGAPNQSTRFPATMLVDWIRYWPYAG
jgi:beta-glucanase (GH16 family)